MCENKTFGRLSIRYFYFISLFQKELLCLRLQELLGSSKIVSDNKTRIIIESLFLIETHLFCFSRVK